MIQFIQLPKLGDLIVFHLLKGEMVIVKAEATDAVKSLLEMKGQNRVIHAWEAAVALPPEQATYFTRDEVKNLTSFVASELMIGHFWESNQRALKAEAAYRAEEPDPT